MRTIISLGKVVVLGLIVGMWPSTSMGSVDEGESAISVYLPENRPAIVECVVAEEGIRDQNSRLKKLTDNPVPTFENELILTPQPVRITSQSRPVDRLIAEALSKEVAALVRTASFSESDSMALDATSYYFISWQEGIGDICGFVESPAEDSVPGHLVRFSGLLKGFTEGRVSQQTLEEGLKDLGDSRGSAGQSSLDVVDVASCEDAWFTKNWGEHMVNEVKEPIRVSQIQGRVTSIGGEWPTGVKVLAEFVAPEKPEKLYRAKVGVDGQFSIADVPEGEYCFRAGAEGWQSVMALVFLSGDADPDSRIEIELFLGV